MGLVVYALYSSDLDGGPFFTQSLAAAKKEADFYGLDDYWVDRVTLAEDAPKELAIRLLNRSRYYSEARTVYRSQHE